LDGRKWNVALRRHSILSNNEAVMRNSARHVAESIFDRNKRRESEINDALKQENARHDAAMKNLERLRALRIERDAQQPRK
jgi:hypothetical protein